MNEEWCKISATLTDAEIQLPCIERQDLNFTIGKSKYFCMKESEIIIKYGVRFFTLWHFGMVVQ